MLMLLFFSFRRRDVRQHRETMKQLIAILSSLILTSVLYAHEGHHHGEGTPLWSAAKVFVRLPHASRNVVIYREVLQHSTVCSDDSLV